MIYDVTAFGASPAASAVQNQQSIQSAIDLAAAAGGGIVRVPSGRFETANLRLFSNIRLELSPGAVLTGSSRYEDYSVSSTPYPCVNMIGIPSAAKDTRWCALLYANMYKMWKSAAAEHWRERECPILMRLILCCAARCCCFLRAAHMYASVGLRFEIRPCMPFWLPEAVTSYLRNSRFFLHRQKMETGWTSTAARI